MSELGYRIEHLDNVTLVTNLPLFPEKRGSKNHPGDIRILGMSYQLIENILQKPLLDR